MWWAAPLVLVAATGITVAVLVAPSLAGRTTVPTRLVVVEHSGSPTQQVTPHPAGTHHPSTHRTSSPASTPATPATAPTQPVTPRVVTPQRPVVTEPPDDRNKRDDPAGSGDG